MNTDKISTLENDTLDKLFGVSIHEDNDLAQLRS